MNSFQVKHGEIKKNLVVIIKGWKSAVWINNNSRSRGQHKAFKKWWWRWGDCWSKVKVEYRNVRGDSLSLSLSLFNLFNLAPNNNNNRHLSFLWITWQLRCSDYRLLDDEGISKSIPIVLYYLWVRAYRMLIKRRAHDIRTTWCYLASLHWHWIRENPFYPSHVTFISSFFFLQFTLPFLLISNFFFNSMPIFVFVIVREMDGGHGRGPSIGTRGVIESRHGKFVFTLIAKLMSSCLRSRSDLIT